MMREGSSEGQSKQARVGVLGNSVFITNFGVDCECNAKAQ
jgi:hypothetical protein